MSKKKKGILASLLVSGALALVGCSSSTVDEVRTPPKELPVATIVFKDYGTVEAELYLILLQIQ